MKGSIRVRLLATLTGMLLVTWLVLSTIVYLGTRTEVRALMDADMGHLAHLLLNQARHEAEEGELHEFAETYDFGSGQDGLEAQIWDEGEHLVLRSPGAPARPFSGLFDGYADVELAGERWRAVSLVDDVSGFKVQVAMPWGKRDERTLIAVSRMALPILLLLPVVGVLIWLAVDRSLSPLARVADEVAKRDGDVLSPLDTGPVPVEVKPLVTELNQLFRRLAESHDKFGRFSADAAHELRTPLAGIKTQVQGALRAPHAGHYRRTLEQVLSGVNRATHLVDQMLVLSRVEPERMEFTLRPTNLANVASEVLAEVTPQALARRIEPSLEDSGSAWIAGNEDLLRLLVRNLVDNAVRYTPEEGRVTVRVGARRNHAFLIVEDTGPGIPGSAQRQVFQRFYRMRNTQAPGCGLGLSIVERIAALHGAVVTLKNRSNGPGLVAQVRFRSAAPGRAPLAEAV